MEKSGIVAVVFVTLLMIVLMFNTTVTTTKEPLRENNHANINR